MRRIECVAGEEPNRVTGSERSLCSEDPGMCAKVDVVDLVNTSLVRGIHGIEVVEDLADVLSHRAPALRCSCKALSTGSTNER
jgi:hypothetical protein